VWIAAFAYEEFGEFKDAGTLFYAADFWSLWDIGIIGIGVAYLISSRYFDRPNLILNYDTHPSDRWLSQSKWHNWGKVDMVR
jgi:hypothetical protein